MSPYPAPCAQKPQFAAHRLNAEITPIRLCEAKTIHGRCDGHTSFHQVNQASKPNASVDHLPFAPGANAIPEYR
jgi:hypothetical protein